MRTISLRDLRNRSSQLLREVESGEQFLITLEGRRAALLSPCPNRQWVSMEEVLKLLRANSPDPELFADIAELEELEITDPWPR
jgi:prevent-host-death family protein